MCSYNNLHRSFEWSYRLHHRHISFHTSFERLHRLSMNTMFASTHIIKEELLSRSANLKYFLLSSYIELCFLSADFKHEVDPV